MNNYKNTKWANRIVELQKEDGSWGYFSMKIRKAVGAVVFQDNEYLLVHKVKSIDTKSNITGQWDFPKGGVYELDENLEAAILRELREETGSNNYNIISRFDKKICFTFPEGHRYDKQETVMFYIEYLGNRRELKSKDEEVDKVKFFSKDEVMNILKLEETQKFLSEVIW